MNFIISVGRNIGSNPMDISRWQACQQEILEVARLYGGAIFFQGCGQAAYIDVQEESFTVIGALRGGSSPIGTMNAHDMEQDLEVVAHRFEQEAIALTFGEPKFVTGQKYKKANP